MVRPRGGETRRTLNLSQGSQNPVPSQEQPAPPAPSALRRSARLIEKRQRLIQEEETRERQRLIQEGIMAAEAFMRLDEEEARERQRLIQEGIVAAEEFRRVDEEVERELQERLANEAAQQGPANHEASDGAARLLRGELELCRQFSNDALLTSFAELHNVELQPAPEGELRLDSLNRRAQGWLEVGRRRGDAGGLRTRAIDIGVEWHHNFGRVFRNYCAQLEAADSSQDTFCPEVPMPRIFPWLMEDKWHSAALSFTDSMRRCDVHYCSNCGTIRLVQCQFCQFSVAGNNISPLMEIPDFLAVLNVDEERLISRLDVVFRVQNLSHGRMGMKGTSIVFPKTSALRPESILPRGTSDFVVVRKRGTRNVSIELVIRRQVCLTALCGLVYGISHRRLDAQGGHEYLFPSDRGVIDCYGNECNTDGWEDFAFRACPAYRGVEVNFLWTPPRTVEIDVEDDNADVDLGPAPETREEVDAVDTVGGIHVGDEEQTITARALKKIRELRRAGGTSGSVGVVSAMPSQNIAMSHSVEYFWTMCFPKLFPLGEGDHSGPDFGVIEPMHLSHWADFLWHHASGRFAAHSVLRFVLISAIQKEKVLSNSSFFLTRNPSVAATTVAESLRNLREGDGRAPLGIMPYVGRNVPDTDGYWTQQTLEVSAWLRYKRARYGEIPLFFMSGTYAEYHEPGLRKLLRKVETQIRVAAGYTDEDAKAYAHRRLQENLHDVVRDRSPYVLSFFSEKTDRFFKIVCPAVLGSTDYYVRYEFTKSRGAIHFHAIVFSTHEAYVRENIDRVCEIAREQFGMTAEIDPIHETMTAAEALASVRVPYTHDPDVRSDLAALAKSTMVHKCSAYCITRSRKCRMGFGRVGPGNIAEGRPLSEEDRIDDNGNVRRVELRRNHKYLVQHSRPLLLAWRANIDLQIILDTNLAGILRYVTGYVCKAGASSKEYLSIYKSLLNSERRREGDDHSISRSLRRLTYSMLRTKDQSSQNVDYLLMHGGGLFRSTFVVKNFSCHMEGGRITRIDDDRIVEARNDIHDYIDEMKRRREQGEALTSLFEFAVQTVQRTGPREASGRERVPRFTGVRLTVGFPIAEESARGLMMVHYCPGWTVLSDLKPEDSMTWADAFVQWSNRPDFPEFLRHEFEAARERARAAENGGAQDEEEDNRRDPEEDIGHVPQNLLDVEYSEAEDENLGVDIPPPGGEIVPLDYADFDVESMRRSLEELVVESKTTVLPRDVPDRDDVLRRIASCGDDQRVLIKGVLKHLARIKERLGDIPFTVENVLKLNVEPFRIIVAGSAGTGKSYVLKIIDDCICLAAHGTRLVEIVAPSGAAASNVGGRTLHSALSIGSSFREASANQRLQLEAFGARTLLLAVDERSMISSKLFGQVCSRLTVAYGLSQEDDVFGGLPMLILFGDDAQLAPVGGKPLWQEVQDGNEYECAGAHAYQSICQAIELGQQMRQSSAAEQELREFFSRFRAGELVVPDVRYLNQRLLSLDMYGAHRMRADPGFQFGLKTLALFAKNSERKEYNVRMLHLLGEPCKTLSSEKLCLCRTNTSSTPTSCYVARTARVKLTNNILPVYGLANGSIGFVVDIPSLNLVYVYFPYYTGRPLLEQFPTVWDPVFEKLRSVYGLAEDNAFMRARTIPITIEEIFCGKCNRPGRRGVPLTEAFGLTGHNSQGMTVPDAKLGLHNVVVTPATQNMEAGWNHAHLFVMLTRVRGFANLGITSSVHWRYLEAINNSEYQRRRRAEEERLRAMATTFRNELEHDNLDHLFRTVCM